MTPPVGTERTIFKTRGPLDPVIDSAIYVPRRELDLLLRAAQAPTVDAYLAILASRQTGKTTLLYQMRHRLRPRGYGVVLVDLAVVRDQSEDQLYRFVAGAIRSELEPNLPRRTERREPGALPTNPLDFRRFALDMARQVRAPRIIVLMDEVEAVPEGLSDSFFGTIRNIFSSRRKEDEAAFEKYLFVLSGAKELHRLSTGPNSPLNIAERVYPADLDVAGVRMLVANFQRAGIHAPGEAAEWIYAQTHGHPCLTQKLCSIIEQWKPASISAVLVQHAADEILRSDDHLEKMISQIDSEPMLQDRLKDILSGQAIPFSRVNPAIARLELAGAIRDDQVCVVRNEIYLRALRAHLMPPAPELSRRKIPWVRTLIAFVAAVVFLINVPFLFNYANDILFAPHLVIAEYAPSGLGTHAVVRYRPVLRANDSNPTKITVDADLIESPLLIVAQGDTPNIAITNARRPFAPPPHAETFDVFLNQNSLPYDPLRPATPHQQISLIFQSAAGDKQSSPFIADFRVDQYSIAVTSFVASLAGFIGFLAAVWANVERLQKAAAFIARLGKPS